MSTTLGAPTRAVMTSATVAMAAVLAAASPPTTAEPARAERPIASRPQAVQPRIFLTAEQFQQLARLPNVRVVDVRAPSAYARGHIAGAVNLPW
jgi:3-mercaptopyruvate sulfurtransferase SseA